VQFHVNGLEIPPGGQPQKEYSLTTLRSLLRSADKSNQVIGVVTYEQAQGTIYGSPAGMVTDGGTS
jgi:hypothetical protein